MEKVYLIKKEDFNKFVEQDRKAKYEYVMFWGPSNIFKEYFYISITKSEEAIKEIKSSGIDVYLGQYKEYVQVTLGNQLRIKTLKQEIISVERI